MQTAAPTVLAYWPVAATAAAGLVAWGRLNAKQDAQQRELDTKASKDTVTGMNDRLEAMDKKLDRLLERGAA